MESVEQDVQLETELIASEVIRIANHLKTTVMNSATVEDISAAFSEFYGNPTMKDLMEYCEENPAEKKYWVSTFQNELAELSVISGMWNHCKSKPYGYSGDFGIMEAIYDYRSHPDSTTPIGKLIDLWGLRTQLASAVETRKNMLKYVLQDLLQKLTEENPNPHVMSVACGSAREMREIPHFLARNIEFTAVDMDRRSMSFVQGWADSLPFKMNLNMIRANVMRNSFSRRIADLPQADVVYSFGLFDYLNDEQVLTVFDQAKPKLKDDGYFIFSLKNSERYINYYEWLWDWKFVPRNEESFAVLLDEMGLEVQNRLMTEDQVISVFVCKLK